MVGREICGSVSGRESPIYEGKEDSSGQCEDFTDGQGFSCNPHCQTVATDGDGEDMNGADTTNDGKNQGQSDEALRAEIGFLKQIIARQDSLIEKLLAKFKEQHVEYMRQQAEYMRLSAEYLAHIEQQTSGIRGELFESRHVEQYLRAKLKEEGIDPQ